MRLVADLTDPSCVPHELAMLVHGTVVPVQPILLEGQHEYAMFMDLKRRYHWVLEPYSYASPERLIGAHPRTRGDTPSALPRSTARTREPPERPWE